LLLLPILSRQWTVLRHQPLHASPQALELILDIFGPLALGLDSRPGNGPWTAFSTRTKFSKRHWGGKCPPRLSSISTS
jgi:hypothetical protein